jgi:hypothetical protein
MLLVIEKCVKTKTAAARATMIVATSTHQARSQHPSTHRSTVEFRPESLAIGDVKSGSSRT